MFIESLAVEWANVLKLFGVRASVLVGQEFWSKTNSGIDRKHAYKEVPLRPEPSTRATNKNVPQQTISGRE